MAISQTLTDAPATPAVRATAIASIKSLGKLDGVPHDAAIRMVSNIVAANYGPHATPAQGLVVLAAAMAGKLPPDAASAPDLVDHRPTGWVEQVTRTGTVKTCNLLIRVGRGQLGTGGPVAVWRALRWLHSPITSPEAVTAHCRAITAGWVADGTRIHAPKSGLSGLHGFLALNEVLPSNAPPHPKGGKAGKAKQPDGDILSMFGVP